MQDSYDVPVDSNMLDLLGINVQQEAKLLVSDRVHANKLRPSYYSSA